MPPIATNDEYFAYRNTPLIVSVPGVLSNDSDPNGDLLTVELVSGLTGLVLNANGSFSYTPPLNFTGDPSFTYQVYDGAAYSNVATVTIHVIVPNKVFLPFIKK